MSSIIKVENLSFSYPQEPILKDISFDVNTGQFVAIAGPNGVGKTTLLNLLCGLLKAKSGSIQIEAKDISSYSIKQLAAKIAVVRQEFVPAFDFTVAEIVSMGRTVYLSTFGFADDLDKRAIEKALTATDTMRFAARPLRHLSGGERQRVFIARALAQDTAIMLLDEPTSFLDLKHQVRIYDLLKKMQLEKAKTIITVTHDINLASQYADIILFMSADGSYRYGCSRDIFSAEQVKQVFGVNTYVGEVGEEKFFLPLGKYAKYHQKSSANPRKHLQQP